MSQTDLEVVRSAIEAWNRRDAELWLSYAMPDVEWMPAGPAAVERSVYRGHEEVASGFESVWHTWDVFRLTESYIRDLGESVLWFGHVKIRGATSHVEVDQEFARRFVLRAGKIVTVQAFLTWREALEAVGLSE